MLTKRQRQILTLMRDKNEELVYERGSGYVGLERVGKASVFALIRLMALRHEGGDPGGFERYTINQTGRDLLAKQEGA